MALITKADISARKQISKSTDPLIIDNAIEDAELLKLKPLLGELLYNDLVANSTSTKYLELLNRTTYDYLDDDYVSDGIKLVLIHFAYSEYILDSGEKDTPFGLVEQANQYSKQTEFKRKQQKSKKAEQTGYSYFESVRDFLNRNPDTYPLWNKCKTKRRFAFNKIGISNG